MNTIEFHITNSVNQDKQVLAFPIDGADQPETDLDGISLYVDVNGFPDVSLRLELYQGQLLLHVWGEEDDHDNEGDEPFTVVMAQNYTPFMQRKQAEHAWDDRVVALWKKPDGLRIGTKVKLLPDYTSEDYYTADVTADENTVLTVTNVDPWKPVFDADNEDGDSFSEVEIGAVALVVDQATK